MNPLRRLLDRISEQALMRLTLGALLLALSFLYYASNIVYNIPAGHFGVRWSRFFGGTVLDRTYPEGIHFILPWDKMFIYDARLQHQRETYEALTIDGLHIELNLDVRYRLIEQRIPYLHKYVGEAFHEVLLAPTIGSFTKTNVARFTAEQVYSTQRLFIERSILQQVRNRFNIDIIPGVPDIRFIDYDQVLIHRITLPSAVQAAIEGKIEQYHIALEWQFRIDRERLESIRRQVEAQATSQIADLLAGKLSEPFLRLRSIDALLQLAASPGSRTVVLGQGGGILPVLPAGDGVGIATGQAAGTAPGPLVPPVVPNVPPGPTTTPPAFVPPPAPLPQPRRRYKAKRRPRRAMARAS